MEVDSAVMIQVMPESHDNVLGVRASGKLTGEDYEHAFVPKIEELLEHYGRLRVLFFMDDTFRGWDLKSAWENTLLDFRHRGGFEKVAMVGAPAWEEWCIRLAGPLVRGQIRTFSADRLEEAWKWSARSLRPRSRSGRTAEGFLEDLNYDRLGNLEIHVRHSQRDARLSVDRGVPAIDAIA